MVIWDLLGEGLLPRTYLPGQMIYLQGAEPEYFYYLKSGAVRSFISLNDGEERSITVHQSGALMGEASFFDQCPRVTSAVALEECVVFPITRQHLDAVFSRHPELAHPMLQHLARTVRILSHHVNDAALSAEQRIARYLSKQPDKTIRFTHEEIGQAVGASRVTVSRILNSFARRDILETGYGSIQIKDRFSLDQIAWNEI